MQVYFMYLMYMYIHVLYYAYNVVFPCRHFPRRSVYNTFIYSIAFGLSKCIFFFLYAIVFRFGAYLVIQPTDSVAYVPFFDVFRVFIAIVFGGAAIGQATAFAPNLAKAKLSANRIFFAIDRQPLIDNYSEEGEQPVSGLIIMGATPFNLV